MKAGIIYRFTIGSFENAVVYADILDNDNLIGDTENPIIYDMIPAANPFDLSFVDNDEDPLTPVKPQQLVLRFLATHNINFSTFATGSDRRWGVHAYINSDTKTIFKGFLGLDDISEAFMPHLSTGSNTVILTATDGLGGLSEIPLSDFNDRNPTGYNRIIKFIAWCLSKTGLDLDLDVAFNIKGIAYTDDIRFDTSNPQEHMFWTEFLNAKSAEDEVGTSIDCLTVLRSILGEEAVLFQHHGKWFIKRIDEVETAIGLYITRFRSDGYWIENLGERDFNADIGKDSPFNIFFSGGATIVTNNRGVAEVDLKYSYDIPRELPDNIDFDRGDELAGGTSTEKHYEVAAWQKKKYNGPTQETESNTPIYIRRDFASGVETARYLVFEFLSGSQNMVVSSPIPVHAKDKMSFDLSMRFSSDWTSSGSGTMKLDVMQVRLYADDGTFYTLDGANNTQPEPFWAVSNNVFVSSAFLSIEMNLLDDQREAHNLFDGSAPEIPKDGFIRIVLMQITNEVELSHTYIDKVTVNYEPYVNGSYGKYIGQEHKVTQLNGTKAKRVNDVFMTDSPKKIYKWGLHKAVEHSAFLTANAVFSVGGFTLTGVNTFEFYPGRHFKITGTTLNNGYFRAREVSYDSGTNLTTILTDGLEVEMVAEASISTTFTDLQFELSGLFYNAAVFPGGPPSSVWHVTYGHLQVFDVWNQVRRDMRVFQAVLQGLELASLDTDGLPDNAHMVHKWNLADITNDTWNRSFQLLTMNQNFRSCGWTAVFREIFNSTIPKNYLGNSFRYLT